MKRYHYQAKNSQGKTMTGIVEAIDEKRAVVAIKERELHVFSLNLIRPNFVSYFWSKIFNRVSLGDLATFTRQLSTMTTTGLTLNESLTLLRDQSPQALIEIIDDVLRNVEGGASLANALNKHPQTFNQVYVALVGAGESAGVLDQVLARMAENLEKQREFQSKVKGAMIYPVIVIVGMVIVASIMMVAVIPKLLEMYKDFQATLPTPTLILISISNFMVNFWWLLAAAAIGGFWLFSNFRKTPFGRRKIDELIFRIPVFGNLQKEVLLAEMTRTLGLLISAGISVIEALNITAAASGNSIFEEILYGASKQVEKGLSLALVLRDAEEFPPIVPQMISVGEETGKMDEVLTKLSVYFSQESEQMIKGLTTAIEPFIMIILGLGVGFLIIAIILPIYNLTQTFE